MSSFRQDLRYALRRLARSPGFTVVAVLMLALGIGPNTATFTMVQAMLGRELPLKDPRGTLLAWSQRGSDEASLGFVSPADFVDWQEQSHVFDGMAAVEFQHNFTLNLEEGLQRGGGNRVSVNIFDVLGERAAIGRTFVPSDAQPGHEGVAVLGHSFWQRVLRGDRNVVGRVIATSRGPLTVIGVMPSHVDELMWAAIMTPLTFTPDELSDARRGDVVSVAEASTTPIRGGGGSHFLDVVGREPPPPGERRRVEFAIAIPGYFQTMEWPLRRGRHFGEADFEGAPPVAIVNETLVRQFFPEQDPLGQLVTLIPGTGGQAAQAPQVPREIVGVIADIKFHAPAEFTAPCTRVDPARALRAE